MESSESKILKKVKEDYTFFRLNPNSIVNPNIRINYMKYGNPTLLQMATYFGHGNFVDQLLKMNADVNIVTFYWGTALHISVAEQRCTITQKLIEFGANVNRIGSKNYCTPIYNALTANVYEPRIVEILIHYGVDINNICINTFTNVPYLTPLEVAIYNKNLTVVTSLLNYNANINQVNINNQTPLDLAILVNSTPIKNIIKIHIVKLIAAGFQIIDRNLKAVENEEFDYLRKECLRELEWMKVTYIVNTNITFYNIICKSGLELANDIKHNSKGNVIILKSDMDKMFKNYSDFLIWRFKRAMFIKSRDL